MLVIGPLAAHACHTAVGADSTSPELPGKADKREHKQKDHNFRCGLDLVENTGIEPVTSCMPCKRSPS